jgi:integrase
MNITKRSVDSLSRPKGKLKQQRHMDDTLKGFGIRITSTGYKAFFIEKTINGDQKRRTIGPYPNLTVEQARIEAQKTLGTIATGKDPQEQKRLAISIKILLGKAFEEFINAPRPRPLSKKTIYDYKRLFESKGGRKGVKSDSTHPGALSKWKSKRLTDITPDGVLKWHLNISETHGPYYADLAARLLRAIWNHARSNNKSLPENPVSVLTERKRWNQKTRRKSVIHKYQLQDWWSALTTISNETTRDYLVLLLFTGMRRSECAALEWSMFDVKGGIITIPGRLTKNGKEHVLPLGVYTSNLLRNKQASSESRFVFPGGGKSGHITEARIAIKHIKDISDIDFMIHDLRRTFITIADGLDLSSFIIKRLVNHAVDVDITGGYISFDIERPRRAMQQIEEVIIESAKIKV